MTLDVGTFVCPAATLTVSISFPGGITFPVRVVTVERFAGPAIGTAVLEYPAAYAEDTTVAMGSTAKIAFSGSTIFRGTVATAPFTVSKRDDTKRVILADDKFAMGARVIGQKGIGTQASGAKGFKDVGFEIIFNKDGLPNKDPESLDFNTGDTADFWRLSEIMQFLFQYYVDSGVAQLDLGELDEDYERIPSNFNPIGMPASQAVDTVTGMAGQSWGLSPGSDHSTFIAVKPGASAETFYLFPPKTGGVITAAGTHHISAITVNSSVLNCRDVHQARSAPVVVEHTYGTDGETPLLKHAADFNDPRFAARFEVDVTKYEINGGEDKLLGLNLSAGSPAKPWLSTLLTRLKVSADAYHTAAEIAATPALQARERVQIPVWVSATGDIASAKLCVDGYEIDYALACVDFQPTVAVLDSAGERQDYTPSNWADVGVWITVATVLEYPEFFETDGDSKYLDDPFYKIVDKPDLVPERRYRSRLPDLTSADKTARVFLAEAAEEKYVNVASKLQDAADASLAFSPEIETSIGMELPFFPTDLELGDGVSVSGRDVGATGDEVITEIVYNVARAYTVRVRATNVLQGVSLENQVEARR